MFSHGLCQALLLVAALRKASFPIAAGLELSSLSLSILSECVCSTFCLEELLE